jgi:filamentous hemagglutinin
VFGGKQGALKGAINFDIVAERGIRGDIANFGNHFSGQLDEVVASNPFIEGGTGIMDWLPGVSESLKEGGALVINSTKGNKFGQIPSAEKLKEIGLRVRQETGPLADQFKDQTFRRVDGTVIPPESMRTTILERTTE